jgi:hypothetical protein
MRHATAIRFDIVACGLLYGLRTRRPTSSLDFQETEEFRPACSPPLYKTIEVELRSAGRASSRAENSCSPGSCNAAPKTRRTSSGARLQDTQLNGVA